MPLSPDNPVCDHVLGVTTVRYRLTPDGIVELHAFPSALAGRLSVLPETETGPHIDHLPLKWRTQVARLPEWLVQLKLAGSPEPGGHQISRSLRGAEDVQSLQFGGGAAQGPPVPLGAGALQVTSNVPRCSPCAIRHLGCAV